MLSGADRGEGAVDAATLASMTLLHDTHDLWPRFAEEAFGGSVKPARALRFNQTTLSLDAALAGQGWRWQAAFWCSAILRRGGCCAQCRM